MEFTGLTTLWFYIISVGSVAQSSHGSAWILQNIQERVSDLVYFLHYCSISAP